MSMPLGIIVALALSAALANAFAWPLVLLIYIAQLRSRKSSQRTQLAHDLGLPAHPTKSKKVVGFFHPFCNAGGGGERVLWTAIAHIQRTDPGIVSVVYTGDVGATKEQIISKVKSRFDIELSQTTLHFVYLNSRYLVEDKTWPKFTMLGQSLGSMYLAWEAVSKFVPDLFIDTMGYAFTFHVVSMLTGVKVGAYVHYPTISTEMIRRVESRVALHNNSASVSSSTFRTRAKLLQVMYYRIFMFFYVFSLRGASFLMVNSSWTKAHIDSILFHDNGLLNILTYLPPLVFLRPLLVTLKPAEIVYPPCDTREFEKLPLEGRGRIIVSLAQFRPEKDHRTQLLALSSLLGSHPEYRNLPIKMVLIGGSRNAEDAERVEQLRAFAKELNIEGYVDFVVNASFQDIISWLGKASIGLSTMVDEHFGINIVEFMAAGAIPVVHASGGPLKDIVVQVDGKRTGYHAKSPEDFAEAFHSVFQLSKSEDLVLRQRARTWAVEAFSNAEFEEGWDNSQWKNWL